MIKELGPGFRLTLIFTILTELLYLLAVTGIAQLIFPRQANGSFVSVSGKAVVQARSHRPLPAPSISIPGLRQRAPAMTLARLPVRILAPPVRSSWAVSRLQPRSFARKIRNSAGTFQR